MKKNFWKLFVVLLISLDLGYSFYQYNNTPIDGDLSEVVLPFPSKGYFQVLKDPIGLSTVLENKTYPNPNRFFAHYTTSTYFKNTPLILQHFVDPIESVYLSAAIIKLSTHIMLLLLIARFVSGTWKIWDKTFLLTCLLITPLFQTVGYNRYMGIIDQSVTYVFFYALSLVFLAFWLLPFYSKLYERKKDKMQFWKFLILFFLCPFLALNGPLIPGIVLIVVVLIILKTLAEHIGSKEQKKNLSYNLLSYIKTNWMLFFLLGFLSLWCFYSLIIGSYNSLNKNETIPLIERYTKIPQGLFYLLTTKPGYFLMFLTIFVNCWLIRYFFKNDLSIKLFRLIKWIGFFSLLYVLLLPFGGFRSYRANIIRYDTFLPITLAMVFVFASTTMFILQRKFQYKSLFLGFVTLILCIFIISDLKNNHSNSCESTVLYGMAKSKDKVFRIDSGCTVMGWTRYKLPEESIQNAALLRYWGVTDRVLLYYHKQP